MTANADRNVDTQVVDGFGDEWSRFDQGSLSEKELRTIFDSYFHIFPWSELPPEPVGFDAGCGSGRWARLVAPRVGRLDCVDASSSAAAVARRNLSTLANCRVHVAPVSEMPIADGSADFGYSLGVLHHIPDTAEGIRSCVRKLRHGAPFLLYLYYAFDNRPAWFRLLWRLSEPFRFVVSKAPHALRYFLSQVIAVFVYWPLARLSRILERLGMDVEAIPLSFYRSRAFYVMRTDALDRFGTRLEKRFTRQQMHRMMEQADLERITFSNTAPFWCAVGFRK